MKRSDKEQFIQNIMNIFSGNDFLVLVNFQCINANESLNLRNSFKSVDGGVLVVKNTLARLALERVNRFAYLQDKFTGSVAVIYSPDVVGVAKLIIDFINTNKDRMSIICAAHSDQLLKLEDINRLASLPSLDELRIKIMRLIACEVPSRLALSVNLSSIRLIQALMYNNSKK